MHNHTSFSLGPSFFRASLFNELVFALVCRPVFLLRAASPGRLSDAVMVVFGRAVMGQPSAQPSGLITGSGIESAWALWQRRKLANKRRLPDLYSLGLVLLPAFHLRLVIAVLALPPLKKQVD